MATKKVKAPDSAELFRLAQKESAAPILADYLDSIRLLKNRGWSYRRIAKWLSDHGVPASFNQVYYAATPIREENPPDTREWNDLSIEEQQELEAKADRDKADLEADKYREEQERKLGIWPEEENKEKEK